MILEKISSESVVHQGYGAGQGTIDTTTYKCPCGKSTVIRSKDNIPGFRDTMIRIECDECRSIYSISGNANGLEAILIKK